jgi:steroid delta-isomerase-like uncharacterized protein
VSTPNLVTAFYECIWNAGDLKAVSVLLSEDFLFRSSLGTETRGREHFTDYVQSVHAALADYRCDIEECIAEADRAFAKMRFAGRHVGVFRGYRATGKPVRWAGAALFRFQAGAIAELWVLGDLAALDAVLRDNEADE